ncbi:MAG: FtsW/RodA/SpoVE family cell cycle protein [Candidatus Eisenbacteria bacterium]
MAFTRRGGYLREQPASFENFAPRQNFDVWLLGSVLALLGWGLLMVYSSSSPIGVVSHRGNDLFYAKSQFFRAALGCVLLFGLAWLDPRYLSRRLAWMVWGVALGVLLLLVVPGGPGVEVRGATRWLPIGSSLVQPAEFARVALIICLAGVLSGPRKKLKSWEGLLLPVGVVVITAGLIAIQPHLSLALLTALSGMLLVFLAGGAFGKLALMGAGLVGLTALVSRGYQHGRISSFLSNALGMLQSGEGDASFQTRQSLLGIGSGGWTGLGLGQGMQKHFFTPDPHTDFILSIIGEELGFVGLCALLVLSAWITARIFRVGRMASTRFGELLAYGVGLQFMLAALLHTAVCLGWAPTTGVPFPLVSFGGSALIANLIGLGLVLSVSRRQGARIETEDYRTSALLNEPWTGRATR